MTTFVEGIITLASITNGVWAQIPLQCDSIKSHNHCLFSMLATKVYVTG